MNRKEVILNKALEMFNERGIEYVGLRELAGILNMRVSNITYYFPTKDDLVYEIAMLLREANSKVMVVNEKITMGGFLNMTQDVFKNHVTFRCLLLSFVHVIERNPIIAASYKKTQNIRNATIEANINALATNGFLNLKEAEDCDFLVSSIALISRFWISEAVVSFRNHSTEEQMKHYLHLIARLLIPYSSAKGKKEIQKFLQALPQVS